MKQEIAQYIIDFGCVDLELHEDYSGRGMYGKTTTAITADNMEDIMAAIGNCIVMMVEDAASTGEDYDTTIANGLANALEHLKIDNMGLGVVVY